MIATLFVVVSLAGTYLPPCSRLMFAVVVISVSMNDHETFSFDFILRTKQKRLILYYLCISKRYIYKINIT